MISIQFNPEEYLKEKIKIESQKFTPQYSKDAIVLILEGIYYRYRVQYSAVTSAIEVLKLDKEVDDLVCRALNHRTIIPEINIREPFKGPSTVQPYNPYTLINRESRYPQSLDIQFYSK